ncbi:MAG: exodeoxyribonuclease III [Gammaproteobacteria bacterium]|nr:exodeoxyribonuclease III [Gammaproteobacteria bacterium]MBV9697756.1 exodeoxyribonuclease III [Gammaproteobacteria bacterium]
MKIATFNINGITSRLPALLAWLQRESPDIACLQELKIPQERFPLLDLQALGYEAIWHGQKSWNGVAILARGQQPREVRRALPGDPEDLHSRYIEAHVGELTIGCLYLPNGNPAPGPKYEYKLRWVARLIEHARELIGKGGKVVLAGDYNIIPTELDVYAPERWREDALFRPEVRAAYQTLLGQGWCDALRTRHPGEKIYTFWDYWRTAFDRNAGLRIDHLLLSPAAAGTLEEAQVDRHTRSLEKPSDHAPVWIRLTGEL